MTDLTIEDIRLMQFSWSESKLQAAWFTVITDQLIATMKRERKLNKSLKMICENWRNGSVGLVDDAIKHAEQVLSCEYREEIEK